MEGGTQESFLEVRSITREILSQRVITEYNKKKTQSHTGTTSPTTKQKNPSSSSSSSSSCANDTGFQNVMMHATEVTFQPVVQFRSLASIMGDSIVVGQEFVLVCLFFECHRILFESIKEKEGFIQEESVVGKEEVTGSSVPFSGSFPNWIMDSSSTTSSSRSSIIYPLESTNVAMYIILFVISHHLLVIYLIARFKTHPDHKDHTNTTNNNTKHANKYNQSVTLIKLSHAILVLGIQRYLSLILREILNYYSSDTDVLLLSMTCMIAHLFTCDYDYANGHISHSTKLSRTKSPNSRTWKLWLYPWKCAKDDNASISIPKLVVISTILLTSELSSDSTSSYTFLLLAMFMYSFYPDMRHVISCDNHVTRSFQIIIGGFCVPSISSPFSTLLFLSIATFFLTVNWHEALLFSLFLFLLLFIVPLSRWYLQRYKQKIRGPWDIAHIIVAHPS
mmetsp:Transcript_11334/g.16004  ORF Transcript_11334/g.16004 Transcript_11334/m.16004 type:complete len:450 (-) Transcript_11334:302-1651(-)